MKPLNNKLIPFILTLLVALIVLEILFSVYRHILRYVVYNKALQRAKALNKKLLVIGDPDAGLFNTIFGRVYGCGDLCLDLNGCDCQHTVKFDLNQNLNELNLDLKDYIVFESCVLEFTEHPQKIIDAIQQQTELYQVRINPSVIHNIKPFFQFRQKYFYDASVNQ